MLIVQCHRGVKQCVKRKGGLSCLWGKCKTYNVCAECNKDSDCKRFLGLDVSLTPTTQQTRYCFNIISIFARTVSGTCATSATTSATQWCQCGPTPPTPSPASQAAYLPSTPLWEEVTFRQSHLSPHCSTVITNKECQTFCQEVQVTNVNQNFNDVWSIEVLTAFWSLLSL